MDTSTIIWIIVGIVVVIAIVVIVWLVTARSRREHQLEAQRQKAAELRTSAADTDLAAREREAEALRADAAARKAEADAAQARADAERLSRERAERQGDAERLRAEAAEHQRKADEVDPDVQTIDGRGDVRDDTGVDGRPVDPRYADDRTVDSQYVDAPADGYADDAQAPRHASGVRSADAAPVVDERIDPRTTDPRVTTDPRDPRTGA
ncbi:hypothetical protein ACFPPE_09985 [Agromyces tardus]|uniref:hypothetical protein n=1 Tax=Agromyces tardus TaxID=2583849 RepID=UPI00110C5BB0|nr:hypothetical protein [Agromyces tardus]